jgi:hypothetical protein
MTHGAEGEEKLRRVSHTPSGAASAGHGGGDVSKLEPALATGGRRILRGTSHAASETTR